MFSFSVFAQEELFEFNGRAYPGVSYASGDTIITNYQDEYIYYSYNAGKNWDTLNVNARLSCRELIKHKENFYLLSGNGALLKVNLKEKIVDEIAPNFGSGYSSINAASCLYIKDKLIMIGKSDGSIEISKDLGETWVQKQVTNVGINNITFHKGQFIVQLEYSYNDNLIAKYDIESNKIIPLSRFNNYIYEVKSKGENLIICGNKGMFAISSNFGETWKHFNTKLPWTIRNFDFNNEKIICLGGFNQTFLWEIDLKNNLISEPLKIADIEPQFMGVENKNIFLWTENPDKLYKYAINKLNFEE
jgi:hypothetical protein